GVGSGAEPRAQIQRRGFGGKNRVRGRGGGHGRSFAGEGATLRDASSRDQGGRLGGRSRYLSDPAKATLARVFARRRASPAAHKRDWSGDAGAAHAGAGDPSLLRRERLYVG